MDASNGNLERMIDMYIVTAGSVRLFPFILIMSFYFSVHFRSTLGRGGFGD